jgi:hypothetical protein
VLAYAYSDKEKKTVFGERAIQRRLTMFKRTAIISICVLMLFTAIMAGGCSKKTIDIDDYEDVMDDNDFVVSITDDEDYLPKNIKEYGEAHDEDYDYVAYFYQFDEKEDAIDEYEDKLDDVRDAKEDGDFEGKIQESGSGNYKKLVINGEFDDEVGMFPEGKIYCVIYRVDDIGFAVTATDNDKRDIEKVQKIVKELGY